MKKILVIGGAESIFIKDFISKLSSKDLIIDLISLHDTEKIIETRKQINLTPPLLTSKWLIERQVRLFSKISGCIKKTDDNYDAIIIHYVNFILAPHIQKLRKKTGNLISVIWGSDFYKATKIQRILQGSIYKESDKIIFTNPKTKDQFKEKYQKTPEIKFGIARFGLPAIDEIDKIKKNKISREELCAYFDLPADKKIVLIGYNSNPAQRQELIIKKISEINKSTTSLAHFVFPLGYGDKLTKDKILKTLSWHKIENFSILEKFYDFSEIAKLRCITDILINIQPSDQFSGSMQETLYAGGTIISGSWLPYQEIIDTGASITSIDAPEDIGLAIHNSLKISSNEKKPTSKQTMEYIRKSSSWTENITIWLEILLKKNNPPSTALENNPSNHPLNNKLKLTKN